MAAVPTLHVPSISENAERIVAACEDLEVSGSNDPAVFSVQMAALLYLGDLEGAKHLWRRNSTDESRKTALQPWLNVLQSMLNWDIPGAWEALKFVSTNAAQATNAAYANEIATAFRLRLTPQSLICDYTEETNVSKYVGILSMDEPGCREFIQARKAELSNETVDDPTQIVTFLESSMNLPLKQQ